MPDTKLTFAKNQKELASFLGVSAVWVSKLRSAGRITPEVDGAWCVETVRSQIAKTADLGQSIATETRAQARSTDAGAVSVATETIGLVGADAPPLADDLDFESYYTQDHGENFKIARSFRERENAAEARINRMKAESLLVEKADVERSAYTEARVVRDRIMGLPTKIAPLMASVSDPFELERMLREALRQVLAECIPVDRVGAA